MCGVSSDIDPLPSRKEEKSCGKRLPSRPHISDFQASRHQLADHQDQDSPDWFRYPVGVPLWDCPSVHHLRCHSSELQGPTGFHAAGEHNDVILARDWLQEAASPQTRTARQTVASDPSRPADESAQSQSRPPLLKGQGRGWNLSSSFRHLVAWHCPRLGRHWLLLDEFYLIHRPKDAKRKYSRLSLSKRRCRPCKRLE